MPQAPYLVFDPVIPKKVIGPRKKALQSSFSSGQELRPGCLVSRSFNEDWRQIRAVCRATVMQPFAG